MARTRGSIQQLLVKAALLGVAGTLQGCGFNGAITHIQKALLHHGDQSGSQGISQSETTLPPSSGSQTLVANQGIEIPLSVKSWGDGLRLAISVNPVDASGNALPTQELVLDSGSSTLAFCDASLAQQVAPLQVSYVSCNNYNPGGSPTGYWGNFYKGSLDFTGVLQLDSSYYSVMQQQESMPCIDGFQGIFGIAFRQLDSAFSDNSITFQPFSDSGAGIQCPDQPDAEFVPPLMQFLGSSAGPAQVGIFWSGQTGRSEGALYLEEAATSNVHYTQGSVVGQAALGELGWYDVNIQQMALSSTGQAWTDFQCNPAAGTAGACIMDTGTPILSVPKRIYQSIVQLYESSGSSAQALGSLSVILAGSQAAPVTLEFPIARLLEKGWIQPGGSGIILGLPLWAFYYTVFDINAGAVTFVAAPQDTTTTPQMELPWVLGEEGLEAALEKRGSSVNASRGDTASGVAVQLAPESSTASPPDTPDTQGHERRLEEDSPIHV
mmetsp:Transcript_56815/g.143998  ORF Transcript_56815/g.143998 Transcript_56815/m.143998 type:complete len:495 (-) Transcript_56815:236-1720(-)